MPSMSSDIGGFSEFGEKSILPTAAFNSQCALNGRKKTTLEWKLKCYTEHRSESFQFLSGGSSLPQYKWIFVRNPYLIFNL